MSSVALGNHCSNMYASDGFPKIEVGLEHCRYVAIQDHAAFAGLLALILLQLKAKMAGNL